MLTIIYALFRFVSSLIALLLTIVLILVTALTYELTYNNPAYILPLFMNLFDFFDIELSAQNLSIASALLVFLIGISLLILIFGSIAWKIKVERNLADIRIQNSRILRLLESDSRSSD